MPKSYLIFVLVFLSIISFNLHATNLFDSKRGVKDAVTGKKAAKPVKAAPKVTNITYKLIAVSKLANKYNLTFQNIRKRDKVHFKWEKNSDSKESPIPGYYVYDIVNRRVLFKAVNDSKFRCHESKKEKVSCDPKNKIVAYELVTSKPTRTASIKQPRNNAKKTPNKNNRQNNKNKNNTNKNKAKKPFEPKRIDKNDIPDDMRLIKTPFGDRLVPK